MSDDLQQPVEAVEPNAGTEIPGEARPADEIEGRARAQGWVPKEQFRGDPEKWRDADEFVRRGEEELPILRERNRSMERKLQELETQFRSRDGEYERKLANFARMSEMALVNQRAQLERSYTQAMLEAGESGDRQRYFQLEQDKSQALRQFDKQVYEPPQEQPRQTNGAPQLPAHVQTTVENWTQKNEWFNRDAELNAVAQAYHVRLGKEKPGMSLDENLAEVTKYVRQRYPERFGSKPGEAAVVEGGGRMAQGSRSKGAASLSAEERKIGSRFVKEGLFKSLDEYAKELYADA